MLYHTITAPLDDEGRLRVDAILGDPDAQAEVEAGRVQTVNDLGFEVG